MTRAKTDTATRERSRVALVGCAMFPDLYPDDHPSGDEFKETVPEGRLWVMGDHRSASADSLNHGTISEDDVIGRAFAIYWPLSRMTILSRPEAFDRVR